MYKDGAEKREVSSEDYPSLLKSSDNLLNNYSAVTVIYSGYVGVDTKQNWHKCYIFSEFEDKNSWWGIKESYKEAFYDFNEYYKKEINNVLKEKKANNIHVLDMLKDGIPDIKNFKNSLILQFSNVHIYPDFFYYLNPHVCAYSLSILNVKGEVMKKYNQILFYSIQNVKNPLFLAEKVFIKPAFNALLNQFLNDSKTNETLNNLSVKQSNVVTANSPEVNKLQIDLLNIKLAKSRIIPSMNGLWLEVFGVTPITSYIDPKSLTTYNSSYSVEINQMGSSIGSLAAGIANLIGASTDKKDLAACNNMTNKLKLRYQELDDEEKSITATISPEILNSSAVNFLPNNADLNQYITAATHSLDKKAAITESKIS